MLPHLPPPHTTFEPISTTSLPPPIFALDYSSPSLNGLSLDERANGKAAQVAPARIVDQAHGAASTDLKPDDWSWARLTKNKRVTKEGWWQDVREIELEIEDTDL